MKPLDVSGNFEIFSPMKSAHAVGEVITEGDVLLIRIGRQNAASEIEQYLREKFEK